MPLIREVAARLGGHIWLADVGGRDSNGAVFCARLPGAMTPPTRPLLQEGRQ